MRTPLITYLKQQLSGTITVSDQLPFEDGGQSLYLKNMRVIYLAEPVITQEELVATLDATDINQNITRVNAYLAVDAKQRNADLNNTLTVLANARTNASITNSFRSEFNYTTEIVDDVLIYSFEYVFYTL